ncbi:MAG: hypothetical protein ABI378_06295 [Chitinophagaceae bacterium]
MKQKLRYVLAAILGLFALVTLFLSGSIILDLFNIREKEGNYVLFVVWANLVASILYLIAVYGLLKIKKWSVILLLLSAIILAITFIAFKVYISNGGIYETKTVGALAFRTGLTLAFTISAYFLTLKQKPTNK